MIRRKIHSQSRESKRLLRLALSLSLAASPASLMAQNDSWPETRSCVSTTLRVQRLLGLESRGNAAARDIGRESSAAFGVIPDERNASIPLPIPDFLSAQATPLPRQDESSVPGAASNLPQLPAVESTVVLASTSTSEKPVLAKLSDSDDAVDCDSVSVDPQDLLNSLEPSTVSTDNQPSVGELTFNLSDQNDRPGETTQSDSRQPQLVTPNKAMALGTDTGRAKGSDGSQAASPENSRSSGSIQFTDNPSSQSSRRESGPEAMKIQIVEQSSTSKSTVQRKPLVAMLASYPEHHSQETREENLPTLKQLIESERASKDIHASSDIQESVRKTETNPAMAGAAIIHSESRIVVSPRDSMKFTCGHPILGVSVEREEICQLIQTGPRNYSLIGLKEGGTRIALITEVAGQRQVEIHQVTVGKQGANGTDLSSIAENMTHSIRQLYPYSRVTVDSQGNQLIVSGSVDSEVTARKILSLVRKTALAPVVDQLKTY